MAPIYPFPPSVHFVGRVLFIVLKSILIHLPDIAMSTKAEILAHGGTYITKDGKPVEDPQDGEDANDEARDVRTC
jgi:hypothetical protein